MDSTFKLTMKLGPNPGQIFVLSSNEISIGRDIHNDFVINDTEMSRKHARVLRQAEGYAIEDLGSTNGTFLNGIRVMGVQPLRSGDSISFGENVVCAYEADLIDPDATRISSQPQSFSPPPPPVSSQPTPVSVPPPAPVPLTPIQSQGTFVSAPTPQQYDSSYQSGLPLDGPSSVPSAQKPKKKNKGLILVLIIFFLLLCGCVILFVVIDSLDLYCKLIPEVMNGVFGVGSCP
jgi:pSer/pThr/pTyr-binding forkhead associated (FHA) protein